MSEIRENETAEREGPERGGSSGGWSNAFRWIGPAAVLLLFANGRHPIAAAAWWAPLFLLGFLRSRPKGALLVAWIVLSGTWAFQFRAMAPLPLVGYVVLSAVYGAVLLLPFVVDRLLAPRVGGFAATLVLPCAWAGVEYLVATFTPYGSWGAAAYSQYENLALIQIVSVTGIYGLGFLIAWFAAVGIWAWERGMVWSEVRDGALAFVGVFLLVVGFGQARLTFFGPDAPTVRVASLSKSDLELFPSPEVATRAMTGTATPAEIEQVRGRGDQINEDLLQRSEQEARAGARIVFWGEANAFVFKADEALLIERGQRLAREHGVVLGLGVGTWNQDSPKPLENKLVLIDAEGEVVFETLKAIPIPGGESAISARDDGKLKSADTPFGRLAAVICFDMDFPGLLQQAGPEATDMMLVPSNDWREIDPWHTHMARFRAVEQGFNLVRHVSNGLSVATDFQGRVLSSMDHYTAADRVLVSHLPTRGVETLYSRVGDSFAWMCFLGLAGLVAVSRRVRV